MFWPGTVARTHALFTVTCAAAGIAQPSATAHENALNHDFILEFPLGKAGAPHKREAGV